MNVLTAIGFVFLFFSIPCFIFGIQLEIKEYKDKIKTEISTEFQNKKEYSISNLENFDIIYNNKIIKKKYTMSFGDKIIIFGEDFDEY